MSNNSITKQYDSAQLFDRIVEILEKSGLSKDMIRRKHTSVFDEFHVRGREVTTELLADFPLDERHKILDVGCGLGGPCRMIAEKYNCQTFGVDLSSEFIRTAQSLSQLLGLADRTEFIQADALKLPFEKESFDLVFTQHVQMNIEDKEQFYSEICRVLKPDGKFMYYDVFGKNTENILYPLPWANTSGVSFLICQSSLTELLEKKGMKELFSCNQTHKGLSFMTSFLEKAKTKPALLTGQKLLMGNNAEEKLFNIHRCLSEEKIVLQSGVWEKQL